MLRSSHFGKLFWNWEWRTILHLSTGQVKMQLLCSSIDSFLHISSRWAGMKWNTDKNRIYLNHSSCAGGRVCCCYPLKWSNFGLFPPGSSKGSCASPRHNVLRGGGQNEEQGRAVPTTALQDVTLPWSIYPSPNMWVKNKDTLKTYSYIKWLVIFFSHPCYVA